MEVLIAVGVAIVASCALLLGRKWWAEPAYPQPDERLRAISKLWCIHNRRYDLAPFVASHPGGRAAILLARGRDGSVLFESYHSLCDPAAGRARAALARFAVVDKDIDDDDASPTSPPRRRLALARARPGDPDFEDDLFDWRETPFYAALQRRARETLARRGRGRGPTLAKWVQLVSATAATIEVGRDDASRTWGGGVLMAMLTVGWRGVEVVSSASRAEGRINSQVEDCQPEDKSAASCHAASRDLLRSHTRGATRGRDARPLQRGAFGCTAPHTRHGGRRFRASPSPPFSPLLSPSFPRAAPAAHHGA